MAITITESNIDSLHRRKKSTSWGTATVKVFFPRKRRLEHSDVLITESLTAFRMKTLGSGESLWNLVIRGQ